jgi:ribosomal-protein-alanine N-acetyltransferase
MMSLSEGSGDLILETDRLCLRKLLPCDVQDLYEMDSDPEVHRYIHCPVSHISESEWYVTEIHRQYKETGLGRLAVTLKETGEFLGWAGIKVEQNENDHEQFYDLGFRFLRKNWGKGYATEASKALIDWGFKVKNLDKICAYIFSDNEDSKKVLLKCGLKECNTFLCEGADNLWLEIRREDYL